LAIFLLLDLVGYGLLLYGGKSFNERKEGSIWAVVSDHSRRVPHQLRSLHPDCTAVGGMDGE
jgi:hypothetical protein